ncbi:hypothetical protein QCA50_008205 [Cerrena zonata]|uniref:DNA 3'-5' helicase n=1 Tax=Cerrena zonata TaxID=2478898 RepID=A0AAW0GAS0_9APHY
MFLFSSPDGHSLVRQILKPKLPYELHDFQVEGICKSLDGVSLLAVTPTGSGKTAYYAAYMLVLQEISRDVQLQERTGLDLPDNPVMIIAYPTIGLEVEMAVYFRSLGLNTVVLNHHTVSEARIQGVNLWTTARKDATMILLSPEMIATPGYDTLIEDEGFTNCTRAFGVDEVHLCNFWGEKFCLAFKQLGWNHRRLGSHTVLILTTATLAKGRDTNTILDMFGLDSGEYHLIRRSNVRRNLQIIFRVLNGSISGSVFSDFDWVLKSHRKTVIFCRSIKQGDRLLTYLRLLASKIPGINPKNRIRSYNALNWPDLNAEVLESFRHMADTQVIVATDAMMVGIDLPNVEDVLVLSPENLDEFLQKIGRAGRSQLIVMKARGIAFITKQAIQLAKKIIAADHQKSVKRTDGGKRGHSLDMGMACMILADCKTEAQNNHYNNPPSDSPCGCATCHRFPPAIHTCCCSGCVPETPPVTSRKRKARVMVLDDERLSEEMRTWAKTRLTTFRNMIYHDAGSSILPPYIYLPDLTIQTLLDEFYTLHDIDQLRLRLAKRTHLLPYIDALWDELHTLRVGFETMRHREDQDKELRAERTHQEKEEWANDENFISGVLSFDSPQCGLPLMDSSIHNSPGRKRAGSSHKSQSTASKRQR